MDNLSPGDLRITEPARGKKSSTRSKNGCLTCRAKRVKCDQDVSDGLATCRRCDRLNLKCVQPCSRVMPSLGERRRGLGPLKSRSGVAWSPKPILPNCLPSPIPESSAADDSSLEPNMEMFYDGMDENWSTTYPSPGTDCSTPLGNLQALDTMGIMSLNAEWLLPYPQQLNSPFVNVGNQLKSLSLTTSTSVESITLENGASLTNDEKQALTYFRTSFSLSQTTRDPQWSTTTLLLEHSVKYSDMLLHLILAVSLYDLQSRGDISTMADFAAQRHYETGAQDLAQALQSEEDLNHIGVLGSLYCVYAYMSRQPFLSSSKIDRLSFTALEYIRKKRLDVAFLTPNPASSASQPASTIAKKAEQSLIARLIMWLIKIDTQCCFLGCTPSLLSYFEPRPELMAGIQATSRLALQLNWDKSYPISQSIRDIESNMSMDMMADLLIMSYKISKFSQNSILGESPHFFGLKKDLERLEVKYGAVFYYGSSEMTLQPAMKLNCATSATMFYATKLYLLRCNPSRFGDESSSESTHALGQLLLFAKHVCIGGVPQPVYELQWSLFIACLETNDTIHQEWLAAKMCDARFRGVLERIFVLKRESGGEIDLNSVKRILQGPP